MKGVIRGKADNQTYWIDGRQVPEFEFREAFPPQSLTGGNFGGTPTKGWPIYSDSLAVHPEQREEHEAAAKAKGVPTETLPDGRVVLRNRAHRREYLKAFKFFDRDGGFSD